MDSFLLREDCCNACTFNFQDIKTAINNCVTHIIGQPESALSLSGTYNWIVDNSYQFLCFHNARLISKPFYLLAFKLFEYAKSAGSSADSPIPMVRMKSEPGCGKSLSKIRSRKASNNDRGKKFESCKSLSDSFAPSQGCPLLPLSPGSSATSFHTSDSGFYAPWIYIYIPLSKIFITECLYKCL